MIISIDNFFNFLNLIVRLAISVYLVKRYVISGIAKSIIREKDDLQYLKEQEEQLQQTCQQIQEQIKHDQKIFMTLESKFKIWNQSEDQKNLQKKAECAQQQKNIEIASLKKINYLNYRKSIEIEVPMLLEDVEKKLAVEFEQDANLGKKYQSKVLQALEKLQ